MKRQVLILLAFLMLLFLILLSGCIQQQQQQISNAQILSPDSYIACGCGCCSDIEPLEKCLYNSKGDSIQNVINADKQLAQSPDCPTLGCSYPINYVYCD